jgi:hypothetical protein
MIVTHCIKPAEEPVNGPGVEPFVPYSLRRSIATRAWATLAKEAAKVLLVLQRYKGSRKLAL